MHATFVFFILGSRGGGIVEGDDGSVWCGGWRGWLALGVGLTRSMHYPESTPACSCNICLWVCGIDFKVYLFLNSGSSKHFQVSFMTSVAKPFRSWLLLVLSGEGIERSCSSLRTLNSRSVSESGMWAICFFLLGPRWFSTLL